jgi:hypothetical protein
LQAGLGAIGVVGEGAAAAPSRRLTRRSLGSSHNVRLPSNRTVALGRDVMGYRRLHWQMIGVMLVTLLMVACSPPLSTPSPVPILPTSATTPVPAVMLTSEPGEFSIYLLAQHVATHQLSTLDDLDLEQEPILSISDIIAYSWETHTIELTNSAYERMAELEVPVDGTIFVVCLGREPIYTGAFWPMYSSLSFDGVVINLPLTDDHTMQITLGYPSPSFFTGKDPRSDPRILQSLERADKLE